MKYIMDNLFFSSYPKVMGILNVTPDSFFESSRIQSVETALKAVDKMVEDGVDIVDIGGVSTRPNANLLDENTECERVLPVIKAIKNKYPDLILSIDTFRSNVALKAADVGVDIVNDVYGGRFDDKMFEVVGRLKLPYILMHSRGDASNMTSLSNYDDLMKDVIYEIKESLDNAKSKGIENVIIDPGFGFAKTVNQNFILMKHLSKFQELSYPLLVGVSRKSMVYKFLEISPMEALNGTTVLNTFALMNGASILRVHDVKAAKEAVEIINKIQNPDKSIAYGDK